DAADDATLIEAMAEHPELIERPIVIRGDEAIVARPPELLLSLLDPG
ncbi:MAG TPA: ArsC/Spx/MgsR family protein, partial [Candidatus Nanopelagicales bacterium]|nr:ArsC/Spx/MgsR family protein [Candidatus Nanopelagicales bacterium]